MERIKKICGYLDSCNVFADVACDHGYIARYMLKKGLCKRAIVSDISEKSLNKAKTLLSDFIGMGVCKAVCCDGLKGVFADEVLIAGIGGEEIIKILSEGYIPDSFVLQPMKNARAVREFLINRGAKITSDDIFTDGKKYYFIIKGEKRGEQTYSENELEYGKSSLKNPVLYDYLRGELAKKQEYLKNNLSPASKAKIDGDIERIKDMIKWN